MATEFGYEANWEGYALAAEQLAKQFDSLRCLHDILSEVGRVLVRGTGSIVLLACCTGGKVTGAHMYLHPWGEGQRLVAERLPLEAVVSFILRPLGSEMDTDELRLQLQLTGGIVFKPATE